MSTKPVPSAPRWRRKSTVVFGTVLLGAAAFGTTTRTWLDVVLPQAAVNTPDIAVAGSEAATAVTAFAVVAVAAALAGSIAGKVARWIIAVVLAVAGIGVAYASWAVVQDPAQGAAGAVGKAIGVSGAAGAEVSLTPMPFLAAAAGVLIVLAAAWFAAASRSWPVSRRYAAQPATGAAAKDESTQPPIDEIDSWDRLTKGEDPTNYR
ncbi:Trp biosynthesis-associated membrane protein [Arthrobacter luteolus]|uniref:Trp biosynthesis-associated membrane protein n=1 Tax=Arthrobacter luteolus TaxID=98672 RepID=UPI0008357FC3|nr:Trp biosynthesis-associated membrane protein [Arthrobacter luteolus]